MPDLRHNPSQDYARRIQTKENWHLGYWASRFGVTIPELLVAIQAVGHEPGAVQGFLSARRLRSAASGGS
jgi:hypothetical protein